MTTAYIYLDTELDALVTAYRRIIGHRLVSLPGNFYSVYDHGLKITDDEIIDAIISDGGPTGDSVEITLAACSEYGGSDLDRANVRTFGKEYGTEWLEDWGAWGESRAWIILGERPFDATVDEWLDKLNLIGDALEALDDYPILDESEWSELEMELQESAWESWIEYDVRRDLEKFAPEGIEDIYFGDTGDDAIRLYDGYADICEEAVREAYYSYEGNEWSCESANSAVNHRHDEAVKHVAETVFGWKVSE